MYAIIATGGKQYKVAEGDVIRVETLTEDLIISEAGDGYVYFSFPNGYSESTALLVKSLLMGLESIRRDYGAQYLEIAFKEV